MVPSDYEKDAMKLGAWVVRQRSLKKKGILERSREQRLDELGFVWAVSEEQWQSMYQLLSKFHEREGHCTVSFRHLEGGRPLGTWAAKQRKMWKAGKLTVEKQNQLDHLGFVWNVLEEQWQSMYQLLVQYHEREGHCSVSQKHSEEGQALGSWINTQRKSWKAGKLSVKKQKQLDQLGFVWGVFKE